MAPHSCTESDAQEVTGSVFDSSFNSHAEQSRVAYSTLAPNVSAVLTGQPSFRCPLQLHRVRFLVVQRIQRVGVLGMEGGGDARTLSHANRCFILCLSQQGDICSCSCK